MRYREKGGESRADYPFFCNLFEFNLLWIQD